MSSKLAWVHGKLTAVSDVETMLWDSVRYINRTRMSTHLSFATAITGDNVGWGGKGAEVYMFSCIFSSSGTQYDRGQGRMYRLPSVSSPPLFFLGEGFFFFGCLISSFDDSM